MMEIPQTITETNLIVSLIFVIQNQIFDAVYSYQKYNIAGHFSGSMSILFWTLYSALLEIQVFIQAI